MPIDTRHPREIRRDIRNGKLTGITAGLGQNHVQANLAVLPKDVAYDFLLFCQRNPRPCPLLEVTDVGSAEPVGVAPGADLRTDLPRYRIYTHGELADEVTDATPYWRGDPAAIGIRDLATPDWGDPQAFGPGDVPVFWACGVTPQAVALASKPPFMITHSPGHMFITDLPNSALAAL